MSISLITALKRSLGQGNVFTPVCPRGSVYDATSCLAVWSHVPSGGLCQGGVPVKGEVSVKGDRDTPPLVMTSSGGH